MLHSLQGLSKDRDVVDETYFIKPIAIVGFLTAVFLVLADEIWRYFNLWILAPGIEPGRPTLDYKY